MSEVRETPVLGKLVLLFELRVEKVAYTSEFIPDLHEETWTTLPNEIQQIAKN